MPLDYTLCVLSPKPSIVVRCMNTRREAARRLDEEIANVRVPPHGNQDHPLEEVANDNQAPGKPPAL